MSVRSVGACVGSPLPWLQLRAARRIHIEPDNGDMWAACPRRCGTAARRSRRIDVAALDRASAQQETELPGSPWKAAVPRRRASEWRQEGSRRRCCSAPTPVVRRPAARLTAVAPTEAPYNAPAGVSVVGRARSTPLGSADSTTCFAPCPAPSRARARNNAGIAVNIRGFEGSGRVNMMIDGVRQNFRFTGHEAQGFTYVDPLLLRRHRDRARRRLDRRWRWRARRHCQLPHARRRRHLEAGPDSGRAHHRHLGKQRSRLVRDGGRRGHQRLASASPAPISSSNDRTTTRTATASRCRSPTRICSPACSRPTSSINESRSSLRSAACSTTTTSCPTRYFQNVNVETYTAKYTYKPVDNELVNFRLNGYRNDVTMHYGTTSTPTVGNPPRQGRQGPSDRRRGLGLRRHRTCRASISAPCRCRSEYGYEYFFDDVDDSTASAELRRRRQSQRQEQYRRPLLGDDLLATASSISSRGLRYDTFDARAARSVRNPLIPNVPPGPYTVDKSTSASIPRSRWRPKSCDVVSAVRDLFGIDAGSDRLGDDDGRLASAAAASGSSPNPFLEPEIQKGWEFGATCRPTACPDAGDSFRFKADYFTHGGRELHLPDALRPSWAASTTSATRPALRPCRASRRRACTTRGFVSPVLTYTYTDTDLPSQINGFGATSYLPDHIVTLTGGVRLSTRSSRSARRGYIILGEPSSATDQRVRLRRLSLHAGYDAARPFSSYKFDQGHRAAALRDQRLRRRPTRRHSRHSSAGTSAGSTAG